MATARSIGRFTIRSLAEFGHLSLQPATSGSAEPAAMATEALAMEAVAMATDLPEDPLPSLSESPVLKDDNILVDNDQSMLAPAEMEEWVMLGLPATLTWIQVYTQLYIPIYFIWTLLFFSTLSLLWYCGWIHQIHPLSEEEGVRGYKGTVAVWEYKYPLFIYIWVELYLTCTQNCLLYKWSGSFRWTKFYIISTNSYNQLTDDMSLSMVSSPLFRSSTDLLGCLLFGLHFCRKIISQQSLHGNHWLGIGILLAEKSFISLAIRRIVCRAAVRIKNGWQCSSVISRKFLIKYYEYSFNYLIIIMSQLQLTWYLVYSTVCSLPDTELWNLLNSQTPTPPQDSSNRSLITPVGTC